MAKGHRSQIKRARNENNRETRPSAKLSYARISVQKACDNISTIFMISGFDNTFCEIFR